MPKPARDIEKLLRENLGKEAADAMLDKIDKMARKGATATAMERAITADVQAHVEKQLVSTVIASIGPLTPIKVKPIQVQVKPAIKPITITPKINTGVSVKVGPGPLTRGSR